MWRIAILITVVTVGLLEACSYKGAECPDYTVVENHTDYEVRQYGNITWVSTSVMSPYQRVGKRIAYRKLFQYMSGRNEKQQKMNMTVPILTREYNSGSKATFDMYVMIPAQFVADPPAPLDDEIKIVREEAYMYAVRAFKGRVMDNQWTKQAQKLAQSVKDDKAVDSSWFLEVEYNAPYVQIGRLNEVWMVKQNEIQSNEV